MECKTLRDVASAHSCSVSHYSAPTSTTYGCFILSFSLLIWSSINTLSSFSSSSSSFFHGQFHFNLEDSTWDYLSVCSALTLPGWIRGLVLWAPLEPCVDPRPAGLTLPYHCLLSGPISSSVQDPSLEKNHVSLTCISLVQNPACSRCSVNVYCTT